MPKASKSTASVRHEIPGAVSLSENFPNGWTVNFETETADVDTTEMNKGLPGGRCQTRHLGYVISGRITYRTATGDEVIEAGEAYSIEPGHNSFVEAGTEYVEFSPTEQHTAVYEHAVASWRQVVDSGDLRHWVVAP